MTIALSTGRNDYPGAGLAGPFPYTYKVFAATDLQVIKRSASGTESTLSYPAQFSATGVGDAAGGSVTLVTALAIGEQLTIRRALPLTQATDLRNAGTFFPETHEDQFDRFLAIDTQQQDQLDRSIRLAPSFNPSLYDLNLRELTAGKVVTGTGTGLTMSTLDASAVALPGGGRVVTTLSAYLANNALYNVLDFALPGITFGGTSDVTAALLLAEAAARTAGGGRITMPVGTGLLSAAVTLGHNVRLQGAGMGVTVLKMKNGTSLAKMLGTIDSATYVEFHDFTLDGNRANNTGAGQARGLDLSYATNAKVERIEVRQLYGLTGATGVSIALSGICTQTTVTGCWVHDNGDIAAGHQSDGIFTGGTRNKIVGNHIENITDTAVISEAGSDNLVAWNTIYNCTQGIAMGTASGLAGSGGVIIGNTIGGNNRFNGQAILIYRFNGSINSKITVAGNEISDSLAGGGIFVWQSNYVDLIGNTVRNIAGTAASAWDGTGIYVRNCTNITLSGGSVSGCSSNGINFTGVVDFSLGPVAVTNCMLGAFGTSAGVVVQDGPAEPAWGAPESLKTQRGTITGLRSGGALVYVTATAIINATSVAVGALTSPIPNGTVLTFTGAKTATLSSAAAAGDIVLHVTALAAQLNTHDVAPFAYQARGLMLSGLCDNVFITGCDLRWNALNPGYSSTATGAVRMGANLTDSTSTAVELLGAVLLGPLSFVSGAGGAIKFVSRMWSDTANWALLNNAGSLVNLLVDEATGSTGARGSLTSGEFTVTYSASMTPNAQLGNRAIITATNATAFAINAPTNPVTGQILRITIRNTSGGALGVATFNAVFKMTAWTQPATSFSRTITFDYDGTNWVEIARTAADVPN